ncbi:ATP/GTP-binding protein [Pyrobaculum ferrireducens]|uniref:ATP (GTP)-binding protein n=1 Tax=Pyrobaculum ferrireducens TaxID=1104324 RepID=G7VDC8_9CREN|nr:ATP/GTP-binding protein [Pyrobaculum ferrireducens]AET32713.1 ATP (GTP)-binding protein [Pyrobaculum ferrireducens]
MYTVFFIGTAGSGKSTLVAALSTWMEEQGFDVGVVNLDPAAEYLPYVPDIDIRDRVSARKVMKQYKLGPNASIIAAVDMVVTEAERIKEEMEVVGAPIYLIDTPGQMELFAFRQSGAYLVQKLSDTHSLVVYVADAVYIQTIDGFATTMLLALSSRIRFKKPQILAVNKADLLTEEAIVNITNWSEDPETLLESIDLPSYEKEILRSVANMGGFVEPIFVSAKTGDGLDKLYYQLQIHYTGGEDAQLPP